MLKYLLTDCSEKEMEGLDRFLWSQIVRAGGNVCWIGAGGFTRGCESESGKQEVVVGGK